MKRTLMILVVVGLMINTVYATEPIGEAVKSLTVISLKSFDRIVDASVYQKGDRGDAFNF